ncbi:hypothetical protein [Kordiimonas sp.]|uniref:hypothetical protein n=1 Tax=Kordiimonas sp. TaxID=1970157 RepID=UPI003A94576A
MSRASRLYLSLPYWGKVCAVNFMALRKARRRLNHRVMKLKDLYLNLDFRDYDGRYDMLIRYDLEPITKDKRTVIQNFDNIVNKQKVYETWHTSGTTGAGMAYPISKGFEEHLWAFYWKFRAIHGVSEKDWFVYFIGKPLVENDKRRPPYWIYSWPTRQLLMSQFHLSPETVSDYLREIERSGITCMHSYPSVLFEFARLVKEAGLQEIARSCKMKFISCSSEKLFSWQKDLIEYIFNCRLVQIYGMTEGVVNAYECDAGNLHVDEYFSKVELEKIDGQRHRLFGSSFHNEAFPLVRYESTDELLINHYSACSCGRKGRLISEVLGREDDYVLLPDGRKIGRLDHIFKSITIIQGAQLHQKQDYGIEIRVNCVPNIFEQAEKQILAEIFEKLGTDLNIKVVRVERLPVTENGKFRAITSEALMNKPCHDK